MLQLFRGTVLCRWQDVLCMRRGAILRERWRRLHRLHRRHILRCRRDIVLGLSGWPILRRFRRIVLQLRCGAIFRIWQGMHCMPRGPVLW